MVFVKLEIIKVVELESYFEALTVESLGAENLDGPRSNTNNQSNVSVLFLRR